MAGADEKQKKGKSLAELAALDGGGQVKGHWLSEEDAMLTELVEKFGAGKWDSRAQNIQGRTAKSCRDRWLEQLDPGINRKPFSEGEDHFIVSTQAKLGNKWAAIAKLLRGRTDRSVRNRYTPLKRRLSVASSDGVGDQSHNRSETSSEGTLSDCDVRVVKPVERTYVSMDDGTSGSDDSAQMNHATEKFVEDEESSNE